MLKSKEKRPRQRRQLPPFEQRLTVSPNEAADKIGTSRSHVYKLLADGKLKSLKVGGLRRITTESIFALVQEAA